MAERPVIFDYASMPAFLHELVGWLKANEPSFSIRKRLAQVGGMSPALFTQLCHRKRRLTRDHVRCLTALLGLTTRESHYLDRWVEGQRTKVNVAAGPQAPKPTLSREAKPQNHLLKSWLNVYVKDLARIRGFTEDPMTIYRMLGGLATPKRIAASLKYLLEQGFLRRTLDRRIVENSHYDTTTDEIPSAMIRAFHKKALQVAQRAIDQFPPSRREAFTLVMAVNQSGLGELKDLLKGFRDRLEEFVAEHAGDDEQLIQVIINFCPIGGASDAASEVH